MYSSVISAAVIGVDSCLLRVETDISSGLPIFSMVGFVSGEVREAEKRVRVALKNTGIQIPPSRITVNFAPADLPKRGVILDLPVAAGILISMGLLDQKSVEGILIAGELGLNGEIRPVRGILPMVLRAREKGLHTCLIPAGNLQEGEAAQGIRVVGLPSLKDLIAYLKAGEEDRDRLYPPGHTDLAERFSQAEGPGRDLPDFEDVIGQTAARRMLEIAAAGFHNALMIGPPGTGKSMLAKCMPGILPPFTLEESLEVSSIYSIAGRLPKEDPLIRIRPVLAPHHSITPIALTGGGVTPQPGVISLAHRSVLFLDELPEFGREKLDLLRQPLEDREITLVRQAGSCTFPCRFLLLAAMNPCPCGYYPDRNRCRCSESQIRKYLGRISGPILDRIDLCTQVASVGAADLLRPEKGESSARIRERVEAARERQRDRFRGTGIRFNADMTGTMVEDLCRLGPEEEKIMESLYEKYHFSARTFHRLLKTARTIADLAGSREIGAGHLMEAAAFRVGERQIFGH